MSEMRLDPQAYTSPPPPGSREPEPSGGSLAAGVGLAWAIMIFGEVLPPLLLSITQNLAAILGSALLPPVAIVVWSVVLLNGDKPRTGKGMLLGLLSMAAVVLLLVAACFGLLFRYA